jgi:DNA polymerase III delta prime subunit
MEDGRSTAKFLPFFWAHKDTGVNVRARIRGANVARKLVMEFTVYHNSEPQHKAFLEFHAASHVSEYGLSDKTVQDAKNDKKGKKRSDYGNSLEEDSYLVIRFVTTGGIGIGLDFDAYYFDQDDREVLYYARHLAQNFSQSPGPKRVAFRMNARWVEYGLEQTKNIRQRAEWERLERAVSQFPKDCSRVLAPYRSQQGTPLTQWGMFAARSRIAKKPGGIVSFPAQTSFSTIDEARITLAYGCYLEYRREFEISQAISNQQHGVAFIRVANSTILAILKLNMPQGLMMERWAPREGTMVKLAFKLPDKLDSKDTFCNAVAVPDMFGLPYEGGCLFLVPGANFGFYSKFAAPVGQALVYLPTKLILRVPQSGAQRQVDAVNRLSEQENLGKWQPLLLNHRAGKRSMVDPTAPLNPAAGVVMSKVQEVIGKLDWSESQKACIKSLQSFPAGMLLIQGFPGTGKTLTLVAMASVLLSLGAHVLFTAPSHYAADAICESMDKWERLTGENLNPIRVYRPFSERKAFKTHGRPGEEHIEDEGAEIDSDKLTSAEIPLNEEDSSNDEGFMRQVFSAEAQLQMVQLVKAIKDDAFTKSYGITTKSLEAHVIRAAKDTSQTLMARYPSPEQIAISRGNLFELLESDGFNPEGEDVDMLAELRHYVNLLQEQPFGDFEEEDRRKALLTFQKVSQMVVQKSRLIVSTSNNTGDKLIASNFGQDALGVMIIRDEDTKETETNSWVPVAKLLNSDRICGIVSCGDEKQLQPTVISLQGKDQYNEFAPQISLALPTRLGRMGHPIIKLTEQFRYRPVFAKWPNRRTYEGLLASHQRTEAIKVNANFVKAMANAFAYNGSASTDFGNVVASVEGSTCVVDEVSKSRYNDNHRLFILRLILANKTHDGYPASDITIVCPYQAQVLRLRKSLFSMQQGGLLASSDIPRVATTDSMQGKEAKVIVHDWVISQGDSFSDLGFTTDDHRGTVALTRMSEVMINILPESVGTGARAVAPVERFNYLGDRIESQVPYPCAFMQWAQANRIVLEVNCKLFHFF